MLMRALTAVGVLLIVGAVLLGAAQVFDVSVLDGPDGNTSTPSSNQTTDEPTGQSFPSELTQDDFDASATEFDAASSYRVRVTPFGSNQTSVYSEERSTGAFFADVNNRDEREVYRENATSSVYVRDELLNGSTVVETQDSVSAESGTTLVRRWLSLGDTTLEFDDTVMWGNRELGRYVATGQEAIPALRAVGGPTSNAQVVAYVTQDGRVVEVNYFGGGESASIRLLYGGVQVEKPDWVAAEQGVTPSADIAVVEDNASTPAAEIQVIEPVNVEQVRLETADGTVLQQQNGDPAVVNVSGFVTRIQLDTQTETYDVSNGNGEIVVIGISRNGEEVVLDRVETLSEEDSF